MTNNYDHDRPARTHEVPEAHVTARPILLDLFCGAGGSAKGYHDSGFDVIGVDNRPMPRYPYEFHQADALDVLATWDLSRFAAIHTSPPCHDHSSLVSLTGHDRTGWMVAAIRARLATLPCPWIIENVPGAPMIGAVLLCGAAFGLGARCEDGVYRPLRRHRLFESNVFLMSPGCACGPREKLGVYGNAGSYATRGDPDRAGYRGNHVESSKAMGVDWMSVRALSQAIPPAYTRFIGEQLMEFLRSRQDEFLRPQIDAVYSAGEMPALLPGNGAR